MSIDPNIDPKSNTDSIPESELAPNLAPNLDPNLNQQYHSTHNKGAKPHLNGKKNKRKLLDIVLGLILSVMMGAMITYLVLGKVHSPYQTIEEKRVAQIEGWLKKYNKTKSFTPPASERKFWDKITPKIPKTAPVYDERLLERIEEGVAQECAHGTGEWIPLIQENMDIALTCNLRLGGFEDKLDISLATWIAGLSHALAMVGDQLDPSLVLKTKAFIQREAIQPFMEQTQKSQHKVLSWEDDSCPWLNTKTNWTAVIVGYIVYAALIVEDDPHKQAQIIARAEEEMREHLNTFGKDGYIASGIRYWNYGFRNFVLIAERLLHATGSNINLYDNQTAPLAAMFPFQYKLKDDNKDADFMVFPNFADNSNPNTKEEKTLNLLAHRVDIPVEIQKNKIWEWGAKLGGPLDLANLVADKISYKSPIAYEPTTYWPSGGVSLSYSRSDYPYYALATKGGNNDEDHNHNDLGSYIVFRKPDKNTLWNWLSGDTENKLYSEGYFGDPRYQSPIASSWGHPVPSVNNQLQIASIESQAQVLLYENDADKTVIVYELKTAYDVQGLKNLIRVIYWEKQGGSIHVLDYANSKGLNALSSPIITNSPFKLSSKTPKQLTGNVNYSEYSKETLEVVAYSPMGIELSEDNFSEGRAKYFKSSFNVSQPTDTPWVYYSLSPQNNKDTKTDKDINKQIETKTNQLLDIVKKVLS